MMQFPLPPAFLRTMKYSRLFPRALLVCLLPLSAVADEVILNSVQTPDGVGTYYIDDMQNSGEVSGTQQGKIAKIDNENFSIQVGDIGNENIQGRMRKNFLLFRLPPLEGRVVERATLKLFLGSVLREVPDKPLPPAWILHAEQWDDEKWQADPRWHGLQTSHFGETGSFSKKLPLCGSGDGPGSIEINVTEMIREDYKRAASPVAAFRFEISEPESLDITDELSNSYNLWGSGMLQHPEHVPALLLSLERKN